MVPDAVAHEARGDAPVGQAERAGRTKLFHTHRVLRDDADDQRHPATVRVAPGDMPSFRYELRCEGRVAGIDEAGRGPLAGPVVAAVAVIDRAAARRKLLRLINDSKQL